MVALVMISLRPHPVMLDVNLLPMQNSSVHRLHGSLGITLFKESDERGACLIAPKTVDLPKTLELFFEFDVGHVPGEILHHEVTKRIDRGRIYVFR